MAGEDEHLMLLRHFLKQVSSVFTPLGVEMHERIIKDDRHRVIPCKPIVIRDADKTLHVLAQVKLCKLGKSVSYYSYLVFTISPWRRNIKRSIIKEKKLYFFEWPLVSDSGLRFENFLAVNLLRMAARFTEIGLGNFEVFYIRDKEKREVDFVLVKDNTPIALFEAKESDTSISKPGRFYSKKMNIPLFQIVHKAKKIEAFPGNCFIIPASNFLMLTG